MVRELKDREKLQELVREKLEKLFAETGMVEKTSAHSEIRNDDGPDFVMEVFTRAGTMLFLVDARISGEPRLAREAVFHLLAQQAHWSHGHPVFAAPYISEKAARICEKYKVGYMDLAGNCLIKANGIYIHTRGRPNPYTSKRRLKSLTRTKAARILRVLLTHPKRRWKARDLAAEAGVSLGLVSNVKQILKDREWIDNRRQSIILTRPEKILQHWAAADPPDETVSFFYAPTDFIRAENTLVRHCAKNGLKCAFTGLSAAVHLASGINYYRQVQARIYGDGQVSAVEMGFEKTGAKDANVAVILSKDSAALYGMRQVQASSRLQYCRPSEKTVADIEKDIQAPISIVSPVQVYIDLTSVIDKNGREDQKVLEQVILPSW